MNFDRGHGRSEIMFLQCIMCRLKMVLDKFLGRMENLLTMRDYTNPVPASFLVAMLLN